MNRTRSKPLQLSLTVALSAALALPTVMVPLQANAEGPDDSATAAPVIVVTAPPAAAPAPPPPPAPVYLPPPGPSPQLVALRHRRNSGIGMTISGYTLFGTSYLISALVGTISIDYANDIGGSGTYGRRMLIPLVGPFMAIPRSDSATGGLFTGLVGVVQIAGFALGTAGAIRLGRANRDLRLTADTGGLTLKF
jgi:hypothetical protein